MTNLVAQIAPQRSTQYSALASALASHELALCPIGKHIARIEPVQMGGQAFLQVELNRALDANEINELGGLAMTSAFFDFHKQIGDVTGPFLKPIETLFSPAFPEDLVMTRRYKGKTNELFTHFLCNIARYSSAFANKPWRNLRLFDPLMGGGTTLLTGLMLGADVAGVDHNREDVESTVSFISQYMREQELPCRMSEEKLKNAGKRWRFALPAARECMLASGDTALSAKLLAGVKKHHFVVTDLPYGIHHSGALHELLTQALPVWQSLLLPGGAMVFSWESTRFPREEMLALVEKTLSLKPLNAPPYNQLGHRVDRVIKQRDVLVIANRD
jgi:hypothetical protein